MTLSTQIARFPELRLDSGAVLQNLDVAYQTYGILNAAKTNAILIEHAFSGDAHAAGLSEDGKPGWWEDMIGPGKGFDSPARAVPGREFGAAEDGADHKKWNDRTGVRHCECFFSTKQSYHAKERLLRLKEARNDGHPLEMTVIFYFSFLSLIYNTPNSLISNNKFLYLLHCMMIRCF